MALWGAPCCTWYISIPHSRQVPGSYIFPLFPFFIEHIRYSLSQLQLLFFRLSSFFLLNIPLFFLLFVLFCLWQELVRAVLPVRPRAHATRESPSGVFIGEGGRVDGADFGGERLEGRRDAARLRGTVGGSR